MYAPKVEAAKGNLEALKEIVSMLRRVRCQEIDAFYTAAAYAYELEPSADAALGIAKQAVKAKDYDKAIKYFEEAANMESDAVSKAEDYSNRTTCQKQDSIARKLSKQIRITEHRIS